MTQETRVKLIKTSVKIAGVLFMAALAIKGYEGYLETNELLPLLRKLTGVGVLGCSFIAFYQGASISFDD